MVQDPAVILGSSEAAQQGDVKTWVYRSGETLIRTWKGIATAIDAKYREQRSLGIWDELVVDYGKGVATLTATQVQEASDWGFESQASATNYELFSNEILVPIWTHTYFADNLTVKEITQVLRSYDSSQDPDAYVPNGSTEERRTRQYNLLAMLWADVEQRYATTYVLRQTITTTRRSTLQASYTNINQKSDPPDVSAVNNMIGTLPEGEWLKKPPNVTMIGKRKWQITQEWWWAEKWSLILYNGSKTYSLA